MPYETDAWTVALAAGSGWRILNYLLVGLLMLHVMMLMLVLWPDCSWKNAELSLCVRSRALVTVPLGRRISTTGRPSRCALARHGLEKPRARAEFKRQTRASQPDQAELRKA